MRGRIHLLPRGVTRWRCGLSAEFFDHVYHSVEVTGESTVARVSTVVKGSSEHHTTVGCVCARSAVFDRRRLVFVASQTLRWYLRSSLNVSPRSPLSRATTQNSAPLWPVIYGLDLALYVTLMLSQLTVKYLTIAIELIMTIKISRARTVTKSLMHYRVAVQVQIGNF